MAVKVRHGAPIYTSYRAQFLRKIRGTQMAVRERGCAPHPRIFACRLERIEARDGREGETGTGSRPGNAEAATEEGNFEFG